MHHVDQLLDLFDDLLEPIGIPRAGDRHPRELSRHRVHALDGERRRQDQRLQVIAASREDKRDAHEDARFVAHKQRERVERRLDGRGDLPTTGGLSGIEFELDAARFSVEWHENLEK